MSRTWPPSPTLAARSARPGGQDRQRRAGERQAGRRVRRAAADPLLACVLTGLGVTSLSAAASAVTGRREAVDGHPATVPGRRRGALGTGSPAEARPWRRTSSGNCHWFTPRHLVRRGQRRPGQLQFPRLAAAVTNGSAERAGSGVVAASARSVGRTRRSCAAANRVRGPVRCARTALRRVPPTLSGSRVHAGRRWRDVSDDVAGGPQPRDQAGGLHLGGVDGSVVSTR